MPLNRMPLYFALLISIVLSLSLISAQLGYSNPKIPKIERPEVTTIINANFSFNQTLTNLLYCELVGCSMQGNIVFDEANGEHKVVFYLDSLHPHDMGIYFNDSSTGEVVSYITHDNGGLHNYVSSASATTTFTGGGVTAHVVENSFVGNMSVVFRSGPSPTATFFEMNSQAGSGYTTLNFSAPNLCYSDGINCTLGGGSNPFNQILNTTSGPRFKNVTINDTLIFERQIVIGTNNTVSSNNYAGCIVIGDRAVCQIGTGDSIVIGTNARVNGTNLNSVAIGAGAFTNASLTFAFGFGASATGSQCFTMGRNSICSGSSSVAVGSSAVSSNSSSVALGPSALASANVCIALGSSAQCTAPNSVALGASVVADEANTVETGVLNVKTTNNMTALNLVQAKQLSLSNSTNSGTDRCTLAAGVCTINNTRVTANTNIFCMAQSLGTVTLGQGIAVTARLAGVSYSLTSGSLTDTSVVACMLVEPQP